MSNNIAEMTIQPQRPAPFLQTTAPLTSDTILQSIAIPSNDLQTMNVPNAPIDAVERYGLR
jgi:hypothetical protein